MQIEVATTAAICRATMRETTERNRNNSLSLGDQIADPAQGVDLNRCIDLGQALAQAMDIDLDRIRADFLAEAIKIVFEEALADHPAAASEQMLEHRQLAGEKKIGWSPTNTWRATVSSVRFPNSSGTPSNCPGRRSKARNRAISSSSANGLTR